MCLLYTVTLIKENINSNQKILYYYPKISKLFLSNIEIIQVVLLGIITNIITKTIINILNRLLGYRLKMDQEKDNNYSHNKGKVNNDNKSYNNGKGPNNNGYK